MAKKPLGPNSPPPPRRGENKSGHALTILKNELEHEKRLRETLLWSNGELERIIHELEDEIIDFDTADPNAAEPWNEWWVRLELQINTNQQLEQQRKWLELELAAANDKVAGAISEAMNFDLDSLSETELIRLVKRLERQRTDLQSTLRNLEFRLDKEGREHTRLSEMKTMYQAEVSHYTRTYDKLKHNQRTTAAHTSSMSKSMDSNKLPPLDVVQAPTSSRWGNSSQSKRNFVPNKGPTRRTGAGVRNLPKIQDKRVTSPKGKVDKRTRRIKSGNKDKKKDEAKSAALPLEMPDINGVENPATDANEQPPATPSFIMQTIADLAQRPLEMVEVDSEVITLEQSRENLENTADNLIEDATTAIDINKLTEEVIEKTEEIKVADEIECN